MILPLGLRGSGRHKNSVLSCLKKARVSLPYLLTNERTSSLYCKPFDHVQRISKEVGGGGGEKGYLLRLKLWLATTVSQYNTYEPPSCTTFPHILNKSARTTANDSTLDFPSPHQHANLLCKYPILYNHISPYLQFDAV